MPPRRSPHPTLYQVDTRAWLHALGRAGGGGPLTLDRVPGAELDALAALGFEWVWLLGVWRTGEAGRAASRSGDAWRDRYRDVLPDPAEGDVAGSVFAVAGYEAAESLGGDAALAAFRDALAARGMRLILDFVPNHTAPDHPWAVTRPEWYVQGTPDDLAREPGNFTRLDTARGPLVAAYGRDPYFPGWSDTLQLNYRHPALREAVTGQLLRAAARCDGLRVDMAMLLLPDVFLRTWGDRALPADGTPPDDSPFWPGATARLRAERPGFVLMAEVYWDLEWTLQRQGFDLTYDKRLYDRLRARDASAARDHLHADDDYQRRSARFLENHDEERAAEAFPPGVHEAAAVVTFFAPGLRFFHQGQLEGRKCRPSVHLCRRPDGPTDPALTAFYARLLAALDRPEPREGRWRLIEPREAWPGNPTSGSFLASTWTHPAGRLLVAVNYGPTRGQCFVPLGFDPREVSPDAVRFRDLLGPAVYDRDPADLAARGLYLDLPAWGHHVFAVGPAG